MCDATSKFVRRFQEVEHLAEKRGVDVGSAGLTELDKLWDDMKAGEG